jgi:RsiW-degrading membrane proteinase PrsW (M82 family)
LGASLSTVGGAVVLSLLPGAFWLLYVESRAPKASPPFRLGLCLVGGALSTFGVSLFHRYSPWDLSQIPASASLSFFYFWWVVGALEEMCKWLATLVISWPRRDFRTTWDGLSCASAVALGFATAENVQYVLAYGSPSVLLGRSLLSTFAHVVMSAIWGYALGACKAGQLSWPSVGAALLWGALGHGLYDWFLTLGLWPAALVTLALMIASFGHRRQEAQLSNQEMLRYSQRVRECHSCSALYPVAYHYCPFCAQSCKPETPTICQLCLRKAEDSETCAGCAAVFIEVESPAQCLACASSPPGSEPR